jgi:hypothetical protein
MDGAVKLYRRDRSRKWQAAFQMDGQYIRVSTGKSDLDEAKKAASDSYLEYKFRQKNGLPVISKRFADVAALCRATMKEQLENGVGKKSFRDYIIVIDKYLVPSLEISLSPVLITRCCKSLRAGVKRKWVESQERLH